MTHRYRPVCCNNIAMIFPCFFPHERSQASIKGYLFAEFFTAGSFRKTLVYQGFHGVLPVSAAAYSYCYFGVPEIRIYESGIEEKKIMLERTGHPLIYETVEIEYDDPCLDIYNETADDMVENRKK